jgi:hypothetical protein
VDVLLVLDPLSGSSSSHLAAARAQIAVQLELQEAADLVRP